jgi:succinate-semialdehyde dehydrogenase/glutarate-semialdehyde dehydrogenase
MPFVSTNPATGRRVARYPGQPSTEVEKILAQSRAALEVWRAVPLRRRAQSLRALAAGLRQRRDELASLLTTEVGKPIAQSRAEIEKCAAGCDYYAQHGPGMLGEIEVKGTTSNARVVFDPLGVVLGIMPWNFPFWQTIRAAVPAWLAGNTFLFKPAPTTAGCALALEEVVRAAGLPRGIFKTLLVEPAAIEKLIRDPRISGVTLTGSTRAGRSVAAQAGAALKPAVFELGGSDPYLVLGDADLARAADVCCYSRLINSGQSCIAAKRFIVVRSVLEKFSAMLVERFAAQKVGDPTDPATTVGPLARADLRDQLDAQVKHSVRHGARVLMGGKPIASAGFFYAPTILTNVRPGMSAFDEELFGPVAAVIAVRDVNEAVRVANDSGYGLGAAVFTRSHRTAGRIARQLEAGNVAINDFVRSDPALPFGGIKQSGYGRELAEWGARSFVNVKTIIG